MGKLCNCCSEKISSWVTVYTVVFNREKTWLSKRLPPSQGGGSLDWNTRTVKVRVLSRFSLGNQQCCMWYVFMSSFVCFENDCFSLYVFNHIKGRGSQNMVSSSSGKLVEMQIFGLLPRPAESETLGGGPRSLCFSKPSRWFWCTPKFENSGIQHFS